MNAALYLAQKVVADGIACDTDQALAPLGPAFQKRDSSS